MEFYVNVSNRMMMKVDVDLIGEHELAARDLEIELIDKDGNKLNYPDKNFYAVRVYKHSLPEAFNQDEMNLFAAIAKELRLIHFIDGKAYAYVSVGNRVAYIENRKEVEKWYRSEYAGEIEAFGDRIIAKDLNSQNVVPGRYSDLIIMEVAP